MTNELFVVPRDGSRPGSPWWIRNSEFAVVETSLVYDPDAVTRLREDLAAAVEAWQRVLPVITAANLVPLTSGRGFDAASVNEWLGLVLSAMGELPNAQPASRPQVEPAPVSVVPEPPAEPEEPADVPTDEFVERINSARFTPLRFRHGYGMAEVDDFLDDLAATIARGESIVDMVRATRFSEYRTRECYVIEDVDRFLVQLVHDYEGATVSRPPA